MQERWTDDECKAALNSFNEAPLNWTKVLSTSDFEFAQAAHDLVSIYNSIKESPCMNCSMLKPHLDTYMKEQDLLARKKDCEIKMHDESLAFKPLLDSHLDVLIFKEYITDDNVLLLKGRVSIEINSINEILGTEVLFAGVFDPLTPEECASAVSIFCCEGIVGIGDAILYPPHIPEALEEIIDIGNELEQIMCDFGIYTAEDFVEKNINPILCQTVYDWACGLSFSKTMSTTQIAEGTVVRVINRVNESLKDLANAAKLIGSMSLSEKFDKAAELVKRGIIFASSLYFE